MNLNNITLENLEAALAASGTLHEARRRYVAELARLGMSAEDARAVAQTYVPHPKQVGGPEQCAAEEFRIRELAKSCGQDSDCLILNLGPRES